MAKQYPVNEIFTSIQGEGFYVGTPCSFIRLAGCNLKCKFCDTDHKVRMKLTPEEILQRLDPTPNLVVITGGEPTIHDLSPLCSALSDAGYRIHVETNGTRDFETMFPFMFHWITVSPKVDTQIIPRAYDEAKWLIPEWSIKEIDWNLARYNFLQPVWDDNYNKNLNLCLELLKECPDARLSLQIQKVIGIK